MIAKIKLSEKFITKLSDLPEQGMGYQIVEIILKNGTILKERKVVNSTYLLLEENEMIKKSEIKNIEIQHSN
ncbi:hypothetical protein [Flavobacterium sp.]|uniref:hypothetical protein n=1 Tax=Flavobacterium sp. TaxID=239 RepID=UPI00286EB1CC|nr:hypothetical protein [Flavobacterium sp.]